MKKITIEKIRRRIRREIVSFFRDKEIYYYLYPAYIKCCLRKKLSDGEVNAFFAARPNPGAGIGHQMANWIAGYWFARRFNLNFAHIPFSSATWESFLGFYQGEETIENLLRQGYRVVRIPLFDEMNQIEVNKILKIVDYYKTEKVILLAEQDQFYRKQYDVSEDLKKKFYSCCERKDQKLIFQPDTFNIAIHVRRGDIVQSGNVKENPNLTMRYQSNDYFVKALEHALEMTKNKRNVNIFVFSQGKVEDYPEFQRFPNVHFCLDMNAKQSFLHMVYADMLITSKSSFSYKPALLSNGIKICPENFWHGYPNSDDWILLDDSGEFVTKKNGEGHGNES